MYPSVRWKGAGEFHASARDDHFACLHFHIVFTFSAASAADLVWEVQNPFRFFKKPAAFALHEKAFDAVRGKADSPLPANIVWRTERRLNDPDCTDKSSPARCAATARKGFETSRLGWAAQTLESTCYERNSRPFRYPTMCDRQYSWGTAKEDYVLPDAHTVDVTLSPERLAEAATGDCTFSWLPRAGAGKGETIKQACNKKFVIKRVPFSPDKKVSGANVKVTLPDGRELTEAIVVEDVLVVAMGDSFMSGESNPDRPVSFSASREMVYDPSMGNDRDQLASRGFTEKGVQGERVRPRIDRQRVRREEPAAPPHGRRGEGPRLSPELGGIPGRVRQGRRAVAFGGLPPLAIRLSVPRRPRDDAGEPPPRRDAGERRVLRRGRHRLLHGPRCARARGREGRREGAAAARSACRPDLPRRARRAARKAQATRCRSTSTAGPASRRRPYRSSGARPPTASARSISCCSRSAATTSGSVRWRCTRASRMRATLRRSRRSPAANCASGRMWRAPISACSTSA